MVKDGELLKDMKKFDSLMDVGPQDWLYDTKGLYKVTKTIVFSPEKKINEAICAQNITNATNNKHNWKNLDELAEELAADDVTTVKKSFFPINK